MYLTLIESISSSLINLNGFHVLMIYPCIFIFQSNQFVHLYWENRFAISRTKFYKASDIWKRVIEFVNLTCAYEKREPITSQILSSRDFWRIVHSAFKVSLLFFLFNDLKVFCSISDNTKLFTKIFPENLNLDELGNSGKCWKRP